MAYKGSNNKNIISRYIVRIPCWNRWRWLECCRPASSLYRSQRSRREWPPCGSSARHPTTACTSSVGSTIWLFIVHLKLHELLPQSMLESLKIIVAAISWRSGAAGISSWYLYNNRKVLPQWCVWLISGVLSPWRQSPWRQRWWRAERRRKWRRPRAPCACCTTWPACCRATLTMTLSI